MSKNHSDESVHELENIRYALDQSSIVVITNKQGVIEYVNDKFVEISKYSREELIGKTHRIINSGFHSNEFIANLWNTILSGKVWRGELRNRAKDGQYYWVDTTITPLFDSNGNIKQFISIRNDITERKKLEQLKDDFIAIASHELKSPITSLSLYLEIMQKEVAKQGNEPLNQLASKLDRQLSKLKQLVDDLLDVNKIKAGQLPLKPEVFALHEMVEEIVEDTQLTIKHQIEVEGSNSIKIIGDRERISQVFQNLLHNAIKYSPQANQVKVSIKNDGTKVIVCVQDFGIGIDAAEKESVFQKFFRSEQHAKNSIPGAGLGLYIAAEIIKRHDGQIWVESEPGQGSTFCFALPVMNDK